MYPAIKVPDTLHQVFYSYAIFSSKYKGGGEALGSFEKFSYESSRTAERIREIYYSHGPAVKDMVWGGTDISLTVTHVELYKEPVMVAFGVNVYTLEDWNQLIDITEVMTGPNGEKHSIMFKNCIPTKWSTAREVSTAKIIADMTFECSTIEPGD